MLVPKSVNHDRLLSILAPSCDYVPVYIATSKNTSVAKEFLSQLHVLLTPVSNCLLLGNVASCNSQVESTKKKKESSHLPYGK